MEPQKHALNNSCIVLEFDKAGFNFFDVLPKCQNTIRFLCTSLLFQLNSFDQLLPTKLFGAHFTSGVSGKIKVYKEKFLCRENEWAT